MRTFFYIMRTYLARVLLWNKGRRLLDHMRTHHYGYPDDGRVVTENEYRALVHQGDHEGPTAMLVPHNHN